MFARREDGRRLDRRSAPDDPDHPDERDHDDVKNEEKRVVERDDHEADRRLQNQRKSADKKDGHGLLDYDDVKIPIEKRGFAVIDEERVLGVDRAQ